MIEKRLLVPDRVRRPPREGFSWVDRRFLREYAARLSRDALLLYFFFAAVGDKHGLSFYSDTSIALRLRMREQSVVSARDELLANDLVAYRRFASRWRDEVANVRHHQRTHERPVDRFETERGLLRPLPSIPFDTDEVASVVVSSHARVKFDGNRYSVPPEWARKSAVLRASATEVRVILQNQPVARHTRCYERNQLICLPEHQLAALKMRSRWRAHDIENAFDGLGEIARKFHLELCRRPLKTTVHLRRLLNLVRLYGRQEVLAALARALEYQTFDAAYVETLLLQERRRRELPSPTHLRPKRQELIEEIDLDEPDPAAYDRLCDDAPPSGAKP